MAGSTKRSVDRPYGFERLEGRQLLSGTHRLYVTGNSLTDGINYTAFEELLALGGNSVTFGRQTGPGFTQTANYDLNSGYITGGVDPSRPTVTNPWGNYRNAFAAAQWDDLTLQPDERHLSSDVYNGENQAEVPVSIKFMEALAAHSPTAQTFIYSRPPRRTDVTSTMMSTGQSFDYSAQWLRGYTDSVKTNVQYYSRSYVQQLLPLIKSAQASDSALSAMPTVKVIPAGEAFYNVDQAIKAGKFAGTGITSILSLYSDQSHPTGLGAYVIGLAFYAAVTGIDPRGISPTLDYINQDSRLANSKVQSLLQQAVYEAMTATNYYSGYLSTLSAGGPTISGKGTVRVTAFGDTNVDGLFDTGDTLLKGVTVYIDTNNNGTLDSGESSARTHTNGRAVFSDVPVGSYVVRSIVPDGKVVIVSLLRSRANVTANHTSSLVLGLATTAQTQIVGTGSSTIRGAVFDDTNGDGVYQTGEAPIAGRTVFIDLTGDGIQQSYEPATRTRSNGKYQFSAIPAGLYSVREVVPAGFFETAPLADDGEQISLKPSKVRTINFLISTTPAVTSSASISGAVINDVNDNGVGDRTEAGILHAHVYLDLNDNGSFDVGDSLATTNKKGLFSFTGLSAGSYIVREILPSGYSFTGAAATASLQVTLSDDQTYTGLIITNTLS